MAFAKVNSQEIFYTDSGGNGPVVILAHGFLMDQTMFDPQVAVLSRGMNADSDKPNGTAKNLTIGIRHATVSG